MTFKDAHCSLFGNFEGALRGLIKIPDISALSERLVRLAYPELRKSSITVTWGRTSSFAQIWWDKSSDKISIRVNRDVKLWHDAAVTGLISHELSHPTLKDGGMRELQTDRDVLSRGLGLYLAIERLFAGKYDDHIICSGRDRYLGYESIRLKLTNLETQQLDTLLFKIGLIPTRPSDQSKISHDIMILDNEYRTSMIVEGHQIILPQDMSNADIKLVERDGTMYVYANEILVANLPINEEGLF